MKRYIELLGADESGIKISGHGLRQERYHYLRSWAFPAGMISMCFTSCILILIAGRLYARQMY